MSGATTLVRALEVNLSGTVPALIRQEAGAYLESLKMSAESLGVVHEVLVSPDPSISGEVKMMALSILHDWIRIWWNRLTSDEERNTARSAVLSLLQHEVLVGPAASAMMPSGIARSVRIKLSVCITSIAERQFPQLWPTFVEDMMGLWRSSPLEIQEVVVNSIETMVVNCLDNDFNNSLPSVRRQEIIAGFQERLELIYSTAYASLTQQDQQVSAGSGSYLTNSTLKMVRAFAQFIKAADTCQEPHDFSLLCLAMLNFPSLQSEAAQLLGGITSQDKLPLELFGKLLQTIPSHPVTCLPSQLGDNLAFQRHYVGAVFSLLGENTALAVDPSFLALPSAEQLLGQYVGLMAKMLESASRRLTEEMLRYWLKIFKDAAITNLSWMAEVGQVVLNVYLNKAVKRTRQELESVLLSGGGSSVSSDVETDREEFEDYDDYSDFMESFLTKIRAVVELVAKKFPIVCAGFALRTVQGLTSGQAIGGGIDATRLAKAQWDAALVFLPVILRSIPLDCDVASATGIVDSLLQWQPERSPETLSVLTPIRTKALTVTAPVLKRSPAHLSSVFASLVSLIGLEPLGVAKAAEGISTLCDRCGPEILAAGSSGQGQTSLGATLIPRLIDLLNNPILPAHDKAALRDAVVSLSEGLSDPAERSRLLVLCLGELVGNWKTLSEAGSGSWADGQIVGGGGVLTTPQGLMQTSFNGGTGSGLSPIVTLINSLLTATKKTAPPMLPEDVWSSGVSFNIEQLTSICPFTPVWHEVLPGAVRVVKALHAMWAPGFAPSAGLSAEQAMALFNPNAVEICRLIRGNKASATAGNGDASMVESPLQLVRRELCELRNSVYQLLGQACAHKAIYACPDLCTELLLDLGNSLHSGLENTHLSMMVSRIVEPLILNAPPCTYYPHVAGFLTAFLQHSTQRLAMAYDRSLVLPEASAHPVSPNQEYSNYRLCCLSVGEGQGLGALSSEEVELARDRVIAELTKSISDAVAAFGLVKSFLADAVSTSASASASASGAGSGAGAGAASGPSHGHGQAHAHGHGVNLLGLGSNSFDGYDASVRDRQRTLRRAALRALVMGPDFGVGTPGNPVTKPFIEAVVSFLYLPDPQAVKNGVLLGRSLAEQCVGGGGTSGGLGGDARLSVAVGQGLFTAALSVLLRAEPHSVGIEWDLVDLLHDIYCSLVLGMPIVAGGGGGATGVGGGLPDAAATAPWGGATGHVTSTLPRDVLMSIPGCTPDELATLEQQLSIPGQHKKRRKDLLKEYVTTLIDRNKGVQSDVLSKVSDLRTRFVKSSTNGNGSGNGNGRNTAGKDDRSHDADFDLSSLF